MTNRFLGWTLGAASLGMMFTLLGADIKNLKDIKEVFTPWFIGSAMAHIGSTLMAFAGGKLIPTEPKDQRKGD